MYSRYPDRLSLKLQLRENLLSHQLLPVNRHAIEFPQEIKQINKLHVRKIIFQTFFYHNNSQYPTSTSRFLHLSRVLVGAAGKASAKPIASIVAANSRSTNSEPIRSTYSTATIPSLPQDGFSSGSKGCWWPCFHLKGAKVPARSRRSAVSIGADHAQFWLAAFGPGRAIKMEDGR